MEYLTRNTYKNQDFFHKVAMQLVGLMPVLAACHLIYVFSVVLHCISIHVVANKVLSLSLSLSLSSSSSSSSSSSCSSSSIFISASKQNM